MKFLAPIIFLLIAVSLSAQQNKYEEWYFNTKDSLRIYVKESLSTSKDTVIVLHGGFGANHYYMLDATKGLEGRFHFVFYDQRGSLMSQPSAPEKYLTFDKNVGDIETLMTALNIKKAKFLCHSMGTLVGMEFLKQHPEMVKNMVLVGAMTPVAKSVDDVFTKRQTEQVKFLMERKEVKDLLQPYEKKQNLSPREATRKWKIQFASVNSYQLNKSLQNFKGGMAYFNQKVANVMPKTVNWNYDYLDAMNKNGKITIINGEYDFMDFGSKTYSENIKNYPSIDLKVIPNSGHNVWSDEPEHFKEELEKALSK